MSGQYPHPSAPSSQQHQFSRQHGPPHHLPPAPPGQYCPPQGPSQRMRGPPPQQWGHPTHNTGLNPVASGLVYGSPHLSGYGLPGRSQTWPKPADNRYSMPAGGGNPLFNLQMQLSQNLMAPVVAESHLASDYNQEETIDLSSHSVSAENRREKDALRNGAVLESATIKTGESVVTKVTESAVNGEFGESSFKSGTNFSENKDTAVSVIAHNPLSDVLNCSKADKVECSVVKSGESVEGLVKNSINLIVKSTELGKESPEQGDTAVPKYLGIRSPDFIKNYTNTEVPSVKNLPISEAVSVKSPEHAIVKVSDSFGIRSPERARIPENFNLRNIDSSVLKITENLNVKNPEISIPERFDLRILEMQKVDDVPKNAEMPVDNVSVPVVKSSDKFPLEKPICSGLEDDNTGLQMMRPFAELNVSTDSIKPHEVSTDMSGDSNMLRISESSEEDMVDKDDSIDPLFIKSPDHTEPNDDLMCLDEDDTSKPGECGVKNISKITNDWENSNHTAENVESLLENMFSTQDDKPIPTAPQSVIVSNDSRSSMFDELRTEKSTIIVPMKEEELAETLESQEVKAERMDDTVEKMMVELHNESEKLETKPKVDVKLEVPIEAEEMKENIPKAVIKPILNQPSALRLLRKNLPENDKPSIATAATTPVETNANVESEKNPFIEVESELEKMFAGIVEPAGDAMNENQVMPGAETGVESKKPFINKRPLAKRKTPNRRVSDGNVFGSEGKKKLNKRISDVDVKKAKKSKLDSGWDSPSGKKGKGFQKDTSNDSGSAVNKSKGPFIHVDGPKENPINVVVVNSGLRPEDEEGAEKVSRRKHSSYQRSEGKAARPRGSGLYSSTLSSRYDAQTADTTWICVFCKRGPHCEGGLGGQPAGDLFGPYRISSTPPEDLIISPSDRDVSDEQKRRGGGKQQSLRTSGGVDHFVQKMARKSKRSSMDEPDSVLGLAVIPGEVKESGYEVWTHEQCATWAPGVYIVGSKLVGIEEAVWAAVKTKCNQCGDTGAGLGCVVRNCAPRVHYGCALVCSWHLDQDTFIAKCNHHRKSYFATGMLRPS